MTEKLIRKGAEGNPSHPGSHGEGSCFRLAHIVTQSSMVLWPSAMAMPDCWLCTDATACLWLEVR
eukprot:5006004-Amphidinium_carterae.2